MSQAQQTVTRVSFAGTVGIRTIDTARADLLAALSQHPAVQVDCTAVESADVSFIQLLLAARRSARTADKDFRLDPPADGALRDALLRGGFLHMGQDGPGNDDTLWSGG